MAAGHLIVNVDSHLAAVHSDDGTVAWQHEPEGLTQAYLCGGPGGLAYVDRRTLPSGDWGLDLVWLDPQTGAVVQRQRLTEYPRRGRQAYVPQAGPFFRIADRLLLGISEHHPRPTDREFFELVPAE
jgi:outer membrane protein assembly factor BamB